MDKFFESRAYVHPSSETMSQFISSLIPLRTHRFALSLDYERPAATSATPQDAQPPHPLSPDGLTRTLSGLFKQLSGIDLSPSRSASLDSQHTTVSEQLAREALLEDQEGQRTSHYLA